MRIVLIGSGNVATVLGKKLRIAGHEFVQVFSKNPVHAKILANELGALPVNNIEAISRQADVFIVAVSDTALPALCKEINLGEIPVLHTAGSLPMNLLADMSTNYGILYPLQSLRKEMEQVPEIPMFIDGNNNVVKKLAGELARSISEKVSFASDIERQKLHLTAVLVSNFTNFLYIKANEYCKKEGLEFDLLQPLIELTSTRLREYDPAIMQTGPAIRGDKNTLDRHLKLLEADPELHQIYNILSQAIMRYGMKTDS